jgi:hypothetical protein
MSHSIKRTKRKRQEKKGGEAKHEICGIINKL